MKLSDIVIAVASNISKYTNRFSQQLAYSTVSCASGLVTVTTTQPHNLVPGQIINLSSMKVVRDVVSLTQEDGIATCVISSDHDLTENWQEDVLIQGAGQSGYNGVKKLLSVPNRRTFTFEVDENTVSPATGTIKFLETLEYGLNGSYPIISSSTNTFTFQVSNTSLSANGTGGTISVGHRVIGMPNLDRFLQHYADPNPKTGALQRIDNWYLVICLEDASTSKDRALINDSQASLSPQQDFRQKLIEPFSVYAIAPTTNSIGGLDIIDEMNEDIRNAVLKCLLGIAFPTGLDADTYCGASFLAHGMVDYQKAFYIHQYSFETVKEITINDSYFGDVGGGYTDNGNNIWTRAFRDIEINYDNTFGVAVMTSNINLDDVPL